MSSPSELGRYLGALQDEQLARVDEVALCREAVLTFPERPARLSRALWCGAAAVVLLAVGLLAMLAKPGNALRAHISQDEAIAAGRWLEAAPDRPLLVRFSDGSHAELVPRTEARLAELREQGAHLLLDRGSLRVGVVPQPGNQWTVSAGPFQIAVKGTRFDVSWDAAERRFSLSLYEGRVVVDGPQLEPMGQSVEAGRVLVVNLAAQKTTIAALDAKPVLDEGKQPVGIASADAPGAATTSAPELPVRQSRAVAESSRFHPSPTLRQEPRWRSLARAGDYAEALAAVKEIGAQSAVEQASLEDLELLGDAARLAGQSPVAQAAYARLREKHPGTPQAAGAAFGLARIAFDELRDYAGAERWLAAYLEEAPAGPLAREALGRLVEARSRLGREGAAREAARRYLASYPDGPHALFSRQVLSKTDPGDEAH